MFFQQTTTVYDRMARRANHGDQRRHWTDNWIRLNRGFLGHMWKSFVINDLNTGDHDERALS